MGYTHYYGAKAETPIPDWDRALKVVRAIVSASGVPLCRVWNDGNRPTLNRDRICFNGKGVDGHETFEVKRGFQEWDFCKTERKPYDIVVCAVLLALHSEIGLIVNSDGMGQEWEAARTLYNKHARKPLSADDVNCNAKKPLTIQPSAL